MRGEHAPYKLHDRYFGAYYTNLSLLQYCIGSELRKDFEKNSH